MLAVLDRDERKVASFCRLNGAEEKFNPFIRYDRANTVDCSEFLKAVYMEGLPQHQLTPLFLAAFRGDGEMVTSMLQMMRKDVPRFYQIDHGFEDFLEYSLLDPAKISAARGDVALVKTLVNEAKWVEREAERLGYRNCELDSLISICQNACERSLFCNSEARKEIKSFLDEEMRVFQTRN